VVKAIKATAADTSLKDASVAQVRASFSKRAEVDNIKSIPTKTSISPRRAANW
jgi:hypothetical protein